MEPLEKNFVFVYLIHFNQRISKSRRTVLFYFETLSNLVFQSPFKTKKKINVTMFRPGFLKKTSLVGFGVLFKN